MRELIYKKGYLLKVVSWENDGDNYNTTESFVDNLEEGKAFLHLCKVLFKSQNNDKNGIGNSFTKKSEVIEEYRQKSEYFKKSYSENVFFDYVFGLAYAFMGGSETYSYRVCESAILYEIKEDIYLDRIEIK